MNIREINEIISESAGVISSLSEESGRILQIGGAIVKCLRNGGKILAAGNGGSAAEAMHLSEELIGRFRANRRPLPAISLNSDPTALTCIANDFGYDAVFERQVDGLGSKGDVLVLFTTSGNSENLIRALKAGSKKKMVTVALMGKDGGKMARQADYEVIVKSRVTGRIQEAHQLIMHLILEVVEKAFPS
jgi:D-sedoheptulose 7-phosphate isomerase